MMKTINKTIAALGIAFFAFAINVQAQSLLSKQTEVKPYATLDIEHQFGNIECTNWNQNVVSVEVLFEGDPEDFEKVKRNVEVIHSKTGNTIRVETDVNADNILDESRIDIIVKMPVEIHLIIENQFGSIFIEHVSGDTEIESKFGNLVCEMLEGERNEIDSKFGNATIEHIKSGEINSSNGNLEITKGGRLIVESKFGNAHIGEVESLSAESKNGQFTLGEAVDLDFEGAFGSFEAGKVSGSLSIENGYGSSIIHKLEPSVKQVSAESKFGSLKMGVDKNSAFNVECEVKMGSFYYPEEISEMTISESSMLSKSYEGRIGKGNNAGTMTLENKNGDIIIYEY